MASPPPSPGPELAGDSAEETLRTLLEAVQQLSFARSLADLQRVVRGYARRLVDAEGASFVLRDGDQCFYLDEDAISPLWKGHRFPARSCVSGWAMLHRTPVVIEDIYTDDRVPHEAYRPTFVHSLMVVPIRTMDPLGAIGFYWAARHRATDRQVSLGRALADSIAVALEHVHVLEQLELTRTLSRTDELTGLPNRRAWEELLRVTLGGDQGPVCAALLDLDGFKTYNDRLGHPAGDALLKAAGAAWRASLRAPDMVARIGGDEFAVLMPGCALEQARHVVRRLQGAVPPGVSASAGLVAWDGVESGDQLMARVDASLYEAKSRRASALR
jgi:diguanylate cyclase (GGDEF)-like protein